MKKVMGAICMYRQLTRRRALGGQSEQREKQTHKGL